MAVASKEVLRLAVEQAQRLGRRHIGTEHVLLGLLGVEQSLAVRLLQARAVTAAVLREHLAKSSVQEGVTGKKAQEPDARLRLDSFLAGLKCEKAEELFDFFAQIVQFMDVSYRVDIYGRRRPCLVQPFYGKTHSSQAGNAFGFIVGVPAVGASLTSRETWLFGPEIARRQLTHYPLCALR